MIKLILMLGFVSTSVFGESVSEKAEIVKQETAGIAKKCPDLVEKLKKCKDEKETKVCVQGVKDECKNKSGQHVDKIKGLLKK